MSNIGILGGGLSGLALRCFLEASPEILEKESECGGLCRSFRYDGFTFDQGGHIFFSKDQDIMKFAGKVLGNNAGYRRRRNKVYYDKRFVKYPFENGLAGLSRKDNLECLYYYLNNDNPKPKNFREWIYYTFGDAIAEKYLIPYNEKIWKYDLKKMGLEWVERVPKPPAEDIIRSSMGVETEGYVHQLNYIYPKRGGIQALTDSLFMAKKDAIITEFKVEKILRNGKKWVVCSGKEEREYDELISTIPVFDLIKALGDMPVKVATALKRLRYNSVIVGMLGLDTDKMPDHTAVYCPAKDLPYHRVCYMSNFSPKNAPPGAFSMITEMTCKHGGTVWKTADKQLIREITGTLHREQMINKKHLVFGKIFRMKYGYIIYDKNYFKNMAVIKEYIKRKGIHITGRFAEFEYINMDEAIRRAEVLADRINRHDR
ncbi:MAG TPA: FAD-dependent oxidoreductase [Candidatus Omnitrophota bacterium]|nr:FAD-dependent oxidoreductase [Candidatus Omnitrophota bacterium]